VEELELARPRNLGKNDIGPKHSGREKTSDGDEGSMDGSKTANALLIA